MTLLDAIRKSTSLPAQRLGFKACGLLREGYYADIVVFDPETIIDKATYDKAASVPRTVLDYGDTDRSVGRVT